MFATDDYQPDNRRVRHGRVQTRAPALAAESPAAEVEQDALDPDPRRRRLQLASAGVGAAENAVVPIPPGVGAPGPLLGRSRLARSVALAARVPAVRGRLRPRPRAQKRPMTTRIEWSDASHASATRRRTAASARFVTKSCSHAGPPRGARMRRNDFRAARVQRPGAALVPAARSVRESVATCDSRERSGPELLDARPAPPHHRELGTSPAGGGGPGSPICTEAHLAQ